MKQLSVMTASAVMNYLVNIQKNTLFSISVLLELNIGEAREIVRGSRAFTKEEYLKLVQEFEELEFKIEYFENVKGKQDGN